jgi:RNA-directed DNA polymerase
LLVLANVYLNYVLGLWFAKMVRNRMRGKIYMCRHAVGWIVLFHYENNVRMLSSALVERLAKFNLVVAEYNTRIIPFGRIKGPRETFDFLVFTHINAVTRTEKYFVLHSA